ncbi:hypothetical protein BGM09_29915 [Streptomyces sp. CBMA29]|nr:hypothetical protein [Streptomyces sp. CBMA29]
MLPGWAADVEALFAGADGVLVQQRWEQTAPVVRFEDLPPVAAFPVVPGRRWGPGWWWSATTGGHVAHGSVAMRTQLMVLDRDPAVTGLAARPVRIVWRDPGDGRVRSWVPQLFARYADGTGLLADCPAAPGSGGARAQGAAQVLQAACAAVGWSYRRLAPPDPVTEANLRWLAGYRHPRNAGSPQLRAAVAGAFAVPRPLAEGVAAVGDSLQVLPAVYHALWSGKLTIRLDEPLHEQALAHAGTGSPDGATARPAGAGGQSRGNGRQ